VRAVSSALYEESICYAAGCGDGVVNIYDSRSAATSAQVGEQCGDILCHTACVASQADVKLVI
jgi:hypothetical protein